MNHNNQHKKTEKTPTTTLTATTTTITLVALAVYIKNAEIWANAVGQGLVSLGLQCEGYLPQVNAEEKRQG